MEALLFCLAPCYAHLALQLVRASPAFSPLDIVTLAVLAGLVYENVILALGRLIAPPRLLTLSLPRFFLHSTMLPFCIGLTCEYYLICSRDPPRRSSPFALLLLSPLAALGFLRYRKIELRFVLVDTPFVTLARCVPIERPHIGEVLVPVAWVVLTGVLGVLLGNNAFKAAASAMLLAPSVPEPLGFVLTNVAELAFMASFVSTRFQCLA